MTRLEFPTYLAHLRTESTRFHEALAGCDEHARVPGCPEWTAADLLWHLTEVQWFWGTRMHLRPAAPTDEPAPPARPERYRDLLALFTTCSERLLTELENADPAELAWSWAPEQTVGFTYRRQAHEALIHRLDAEQAAGEVTPLDAALAADGVAEVLDVMYGGEPEPWGTFTPSGLLVRLDLTDVDVSLWAEPGQFRGTHPESGKNYDGAHLVRRHAPTAGHEPDAVIDGTAAAVDSWLWKRAAGHDVTRTGNPEALQGFLDAVGYPLN